MTISAISNGELGSSVRTKLNTLITNDNKIDILTASRSYYVRTDGSDSNDGTANTAGSAWLTLQHAYDWIVANLDLAGYTVTVNVGAGTYAPASGTPVLLTNKAWRGGGVVQFTGDTATPSNVVLNSTAAHTIYNTCNLPNQLALAGFKFTISGTGVYVGCVYNASPGSFIFIDGNCEFGTAWFCHLWAANGGIYIISDYLVSGDAQYHYFADQQGTIVADGVTCSISGARTFSFWSVSQNIGVLKAFSTTYSVAVSVTGTRYYVSENALIRTNGGGANYFPGTIAGTSGVNGGVYT